MSYLLCAFVTSGRPGFFAWVRKKPDKTAVAQLSENRRLDDTTTEATMNDMGDDWFYDDHDDPPLEQSADQGYDDGPDMSLMEFEWKEELEKTHKEYQEDRRRERKAKKRREAARKAAETRKLAQWAKQDEERRLRRTRRYRSIDDV
jgi:hypothetical protein